jgi:hypothetical protein
VILMAGFAAAQVRGYSREAAVQARPGEFCFGVAVPYVERYVAPRIPRVCRDQSIQPGRTGQRGSLKARKISSMTCQAGAQDAARFEQRLVDRVAVGSERGGQPSPARQTSRTWMPRS